MQPSDVRQETTMGVTIHGVVEVRAPGSNEWETAVFVEPLVDTAVDTLGCLFGIENYANFEPIAPDRGLPSDISEFVKSELQLADFSPTSISYITAEELASVDWTETGRELDERISLLDSESGEVIEKFKWAAEYEPVLDEFKQELNSGEKIHLKGSQSSGYLQRRKMTRKEALSENWRILILGILPVLSDQFGSHRVRLVVWFFD